MRSFYIGVWMRWLVAFILIATLLSVGFASIMTLGVYGYKGFAPLNAETLKALRIIWFFWLGIGYGIGMIGAVIGALKTVCQRCIGGYRIVPLSCSGEILESVESKHYFKIWRKWFFALIWVNAAQVVVLLSSYKLLYGGPVWMGWFNPFWMTPMILFSGSAALVIMLNRCKSVRIDPCMS